MFHLLRKHLPIHQYCRLHRPHLYPEVLCVVSVVGMVVCLWQSHLEGTATLRSPNTTKSHLKVNFLLDLFVFVRIFLYLCTLIVYYGELYRISKKVSAYDFRKCGGARSIDADVA